MASPVGTYRRDIEDVTEDMSGVTGTEASARNGGVPRTRAVPSSSLIVRLIVACCIFSLQTAFIFQVPSFTFTDAQGLRGWSWVPAQLSSIGAAVICLAGAIAYAYRFKRGGLLRMDTRACWQAGTLVACVGWTTHLVFADQSGIVPVQGAAFLLMGVAPMLWQPALTKGLATVGPRKTMGLILLSFFFATMVGAPVACLPKDTTIALMILASSGMLLVFPAIPENASRGKQLVGDRSEGSRPRLPVRLTVTYAVMGVSSGIVGACVCAGSLGSPAVTPGGNLLEGLTLLAFSCALVSIFAFALRLDFNRLIYGIGLPLLAFGLILMVLTAPVGHTVLLVQEAANEFVETLTWGVVSYLILFERYSSTWLAFCPAVGLFGGQVAGTALCLAIFDVSEQVAETPFFILIALLSFAVMLSALWLQICAQPRADTQQAGSDWGDVRPATIERTESMTTAICRQIASERHLTKREGEVLEMVARGRTKRYVSERLSISESTAKSHILSVYRKLGVHSQQELLDLIESGSEARLYQTK